MRRFCPSCWAENEPRATVCAACGATLDETGKDFVAKMIDAVGHPEPTRAGIAIEVLGQRLREPRAVDALIARLKRRGDFMEITADAARALGAIGDRRAVPALIELLADPDRALVARIAAAEALGTLDDPGASHALKAALAASGLPYRLREAIQQVLAQRDGGS
ncbi:MAG TPA: hypothetical protein DEP84_34065 [Chloroflexi bacterium]|nr:hypothetical protein [Chloroflexota bacterium]